MKYYRYALWIISGLCWLSYVVESSSYEGWRSYRLYQPGLEYTTVWEGKYDPQAQSLAYNHCAAVEYFDGKFFAFWQGNISGVEQHNVQHGTPVHVWLRTSEDFQSWSEAIRPFMSEDACENPFRGVTQQVQVGVMNYKERELWCFFLHEGNTEYDGLYLSRLVKGGRWRNERILSATLNIDGKSYVLYTSVNPKVFSSGRIVLPLTLISTESIEAKRGSRLATTPRRYNAVLYSDDEGENWAFSNLVSHPSDPSAMWEPEISEQSDGSLRLFSRNLYHPPTGEPQFGQLLSTTGVGVNKGQPMIFQVDKQLSQMELFGDRAQVLRLRGGRHLMLHHDLFTYQLAWANRRNTALFFSRSGADDFVAGPVISEGDEAASYPQVIEVNGKLYVLYTTGHHLRQPHPDTVEFDIKGVCVDPAPDPDMFYIWLRNRSLADLEYKPPTPDGDENLVFEKGASAGVETDPVYFDQGDSLLVAFDFRVDAVQPTGNLILCSFGDQIPMRIGVPSNRPESLYIYDALGWQLVGELGPDGWNQLDLEFGPERVSVRLNGESVRNYDYPMRRINPRLYLGDGYEVDRQYPSNQGSSFSIDVSTFRTRVDRWGK